MSSPAISNHIAGALDFAQMRTPAVAKFDAKATAHKNAEDFEASFLNSMFQQMLTGTDGDGPMGGSPGVGVWRSFMTDEFSKAFAKKGGVGLADQVYKSLLAHQEVATQS